MDWNATYTVAPTVLSQELRGEVVLLNLEGEAYYGLNAVGARVWQMLSESRALSELVDALEREFDAPRSQLEADLAELVEGLVSAGLVRLV